VVASVLLAQASCQPTGDVGYVEIRTVPTASSVVPPSLYLDTLKVEPSKKGNTILTQRVGTTSWSEGETIVRVRATLRTIFRRRSDLRPLRLFVDFRFVAAKSAAD